MSTITEKFERYNIRHPGVLADVEAEVFLQISQGTKRVSIRKIVKRLRRPDNFAVEYARLIRQRNPQWSAHVRTPTLRRAEATSGRPTASLA